MIEVLGAAAGLWHAPVHSEHTLDRTQRTVQALQSLAPVRLVVSIQQLVAVWQPVILQLLPFHPESTVSGYLAAAGNQLQTGLLRLAVLTALAPVAAAFLMLSIVEALLTRDKRRLRGGREHGFVYHRLQRVRTLTLWLPLFLFLVAPVTVPPVFLTLLVIPSAAYVWAHMVLFKRNV